MKLFIVESPKKTKTIKKFLSSDYYFLSTYGHIIDLPQKEFGIYLRNGKIFSKYVLRNKKFVVFLKKLLKSVDEIIIATDPDREGEFIAWSVSQYLQNKNFYRIRFFEITKKAIIEALKNKTKIDENLVKAQQARRFLDRIIGYSISPLLWKEKIGESAGRVQSAALRLIVEKEEEIEKFIPEKYYELIADFDEFKAKYIKFPRKTSFKERDYLENIKKEIEDEFFILERKEIKEKIFPKPTPIDTALLQRIAFLKYKFPSFLTMRIAQSLYESGLITYHRTDSFYLSDEFLDKIKKFLKNYFSYPKGKKSKFSQEAHEAIRPIYLQRKISRLNQNEQKLYELIFDYTLASCSKDAILQNKIYYLKAKNYIFKTEGEKIIYDGFLRFFPFKTEFNDLPEIKEGEKLKPKRLEIIEKQTKPPSRYTEASLIKTMKELGIGRPSTYAYIIEILYKRGYVIKEKNFLKPTKKGKQVINFLRKTFEKIIDLKFTAKMEENLDKIALGELDFERFVINFWNELKNLLVFKKNVYNEKEI